MCEVTQNLIQEEEEEIKSDTKKRKKSQLVSNKHKLQKLKEEISYYSDKLNECYIVPDRMEIYILSESDLKSFFSESIYHIIKGEKIDTNNNNCQILIPTKRQNSIIF